MMHEGLPEAGDVVIWGASALLALVLGIGTAFVLWMLLRATPAPRIAETAVLLVGAGIALLGASNPHPVWRVSLVVLACVLAVAYSLGGPEFSHLLP